MNALPAGFFACGFTPDGTYESDPTEKQITEERKKKIPDIKHK